jgi:hypothetical protein
LNSLDKHTNSDSFLQVTDAESQKTVAEKEHQIKAAAFIEAETKVNNQH